MKRTLTLLTGLTVLPLALAAQQNAVARLQQVLPASVADSVIAIVTNATNHGLPGQAIAERALETVAKTRNGQDAQAAAQALASDLQASHDALAGSGHQPSASEIEAGAQAMELGVSGSTISALAQRSSYAEQIPNQNAARDRRTRSMSPRPGRYGHLFL